MPAEKGHIVPNNFSSDPKRASEAGKSSKRGVSRKSSLKRVLEMELTEDIESYIEKLPCRTPYEKVTVADALSLVLVKEALSGNIQAHKEIGDRVDGKSEQSLYVKADVQTADLSELSPDQIKELATQALDSDLHLGENAE